MCMKNYNDEKKNIFDKFTAFFNIVIFDHCLNTIMVGSAYFVKSTPPTVFNLSFQYPLILKRCMKNYNTEKLISDKFTAFAT